ncbi:MAG: TIM barrel protein [Rhodospirillaceae bacterium]|jgi:2-dehydrotetronate isomerase|nr:TIM barrel protein [Rhodospirillaceae bacterium]MBT5456394.1 TIM barrel protein [Rhodospirillaceae bacterium]
MPKFAANLTTMFPELEPGDRFRAAARAGFKAIEFLRPYEFPVDRVRGWLEENQLQFLLLNTLGRTSDDLEPGASVIPGREAEFREIMDRALTYCAALDGCFIHVTAGRVPDGLTVDACENTFIANLLAAAPRAADAGITLLLEPLNSRTMPGYLHTDTLHTRRIIEAVGALNVKLQYDFFHMQIMQGDHVENLARDLDIISHVQISSVPGRHEPQHGELNFPYLFEYLDTIGYDGWVGCEYTPKGDSWDGLSWAEPYGISSERDC